MSIAQQPKTARLDVAAYLERIGYTVPAEPTLENLRAMHRAHFLNVPFENLDISPGVRIQVDEAVNARKLVERHRGGFCLELNGTFARMLRALGYRVYVPGAQVEIANTPTLRLRARSCRWRPSRSSKPKRSAMPAAI